MYFGGGTPSILPVNFISKIINKFNYTENPEITLEVNPDDANEKYFEELLKSGVNRLSIGSQTFNDDILIEIGRRHNSTQIISAVNKAKSAGFENISLDLIYGLPEQNINNLKIDLERLIELDVNHISTYGLKIEEGSVYYKKLPKNIPDEDIQADMYELINKTLENNGFERYEISNFSKTGFCSRHNLNYWNNEEYYGFGVAAHGYVDNIRYSNFCTIEKYMENPSNHEFGHFVTSQEKLEEEIFLGFRKASGIDVNKINEKYAINFEEKYKKVLDKYEDYIIKTPIGYTFNLKGVLISNVILSEFI